MRNKLAIALFALALPACSTNAPGVVGTSNGVIATTNIGFENTSGAAISNFTATPNYGLGTFPIVVAESATPKYTGTFTVAPKAGGATCISVTGSPGTTFTVTETCTVSAAGSFTVTDTNGNQAVMVINYITN